ncbi:MAG: L-lactate dehydrogenase [Clostridia bacterium]|nr:L-lactate dehydrogenase [Clostridia bacterium]
MRSKITIIGTGSVGATIAYTVAVKSIASEVVLIDVNGNKAAGEAMDIRQGTPLCDEPVDIMAGDYENARGSDIVIITSGIARKPGQTRLELTQTNVNILKSITPKIVEVAPDAIYILVSNPVDILTYVFNKISGIPEHRIIGTGTLLDTARLRSRLADDLLISQKSVHAYVLGEHGDSSFIPWSIAQISSIDLQDYMERIRLDNGRRMPELDYDAIEEYIRTSGGKIIQNKGATYYAIAISVCRICETLYGSANGVATISTMMHGEFGMEDVCLSIPTIYGPDGIRGKILPELTEEEVAKLQHSANVLKGVIAQVEI